MADSTSKNAFHKACLNSDSLWTNAIDKKMPLQEIVKMENLPACIIVRVLLTHFYTKVYHMPLESESAVKKEITHSLRDPNKIPDPLLMEITIQAVQMDRYFSPSAEVSKFESGKLNEESIALWLQSYNISSFSEDLLRSQGYPKTPDFALVIPIGFYNEKHKKYHVINWIESKGMFGSEFHHKKFLNEQYWSYHNRFGPGLVIYWGGYVEEVETMQSSSTIYVSWKLPEKIVKLESHFSY